MLIENIETSLLELVAGLEFKEKNRILNDILGIIHKISDIPHPVGCVQWVPVEDVQANDYNPNSVAPIEMGLLYTSISKDGYTQPTVVIWDEEVKKYIIIDGFHRYFVMKSSPDIYAQTQGLFPVVVLEKDINERMAATVRHNRARGTHSVKGMSSMVFEMLKNGKSDVEICNELGMQPEELVKLKHITGYSKLYSNVEYNRSWVFNKGELKKN